MTSYTRIQHVQISPLMRSSQATLRRIGSQRLASANIYIFCLVCPVFLHLLSIRTYDLSQYLQPEPSLDIIRPFVSTIPSDVTLNRLAQLEDEVTKLHNQRATSCRTPQGRTLCSSNTTNLVWYNPSNRDRFICNAIVLGPGKTYKAVSSFSSVVESACLSNAWRGSLTSHSFPREATVENKGVFPGISIQNQKTKPIDDSFSSNIEQYTFPTDDASQKNNLFDKTASDGLEFRVEDRNRKWKKEGFLRCDIKCEFQEQNGLLMRKYIYGTDWKFELSIEGSHYYPELAIDEYDWRNNNYFSTTSFKSEVPATYFSILDNWWGDTLQTPAVDYSTAIKGASFLARNCNAKNNRNDVVNELIEAGFRVDSLSSCLHNAEPPPDVDMSNKTNVMEKYLFHLGFENGRVDDYVTEKLWMAFHSGTLPVLLGPTNIKEHIGSFHGAIYVDDFPTVKDLAKYLTEVANNQTLYESYHDWRKKPYPEEFLEKYNFTRVHNTCRMCRWAFAKKYGMGWDHVKQTIEPVALSRDTCVESNAMIHPVNESWWSSTSGNTRRKLNLSPLSVHDHTLCPVMNGTVLTSRIGIDRFIRSIWSHDGVTDIYLEGQLTKTVILTLQLPMISTSTQVHGENTIWFQNEQSRISLIFNADGVDSFDINSISMVASSLDSVAISVHPDNVPMRIRIVLEDQDTLHKDAAKYESYYGEIMAEDVLNMPELFVLES